MTLRETNALLGYVQRGVIEQENNSLSRYSSGANKPGILYSILGIASPEKY